MFSFYFSILPILDIREKTRYSNQLYNSNTEFKQFCLFFIYFL